MSKKLTLAGATTFVATDAKGPAHNSVDASIEQGIFPSSQLARAVWVIFIILLASMLPGCSGTTSATTTPTSPRTPAAPSVTATYATYPTLGAPFEAVVSGSGPVFVGESGGIQIFSPNTNGTLAPTCLNALPSSLRSEGAAVSELSFLPNATNVAAGIGSPGAIFYNTTSLQSCTASGYIVSQGSIASDQGTQAVAVSPDGRYAFVSNEYGVVPGTVTQGNIGVVSLQYDSMEMSRQGARCWDKSRRGAMPLLA